MDFTTAMTISVILNDLWYSSSLHIDWYYTLRAAWYSIRRFKG